MCRIIFEKKKKFVNHSFKFIIHQLKILKKKNICRCVREKDLDLSSSYLNFFFFFENIFSFLIYEKTLQYFNTTLFFVLKNVIF